MSEDYQFHPQMVKLAIREDFERFLDVIVGQQRFLQM